MNEKKEEMAIITKPEFKGEIRAQIKGLSQIEDNIKEVNEFAVKLNEYYSNVIFTEETLKEAKTEKANINKFKDKVADFRKKIVAEYNKPIEIFEKTAKETEALLKETYTNINLQVQKFEDQQKQEKEKDVKEYYQEYAKSNNLEWITEEKYYQMANINVTLSASIKSLMEQAKTFIDKILDDLKLISTQQNEIEILAEYKQTLNVSLAITTVAERMKRLEEERKIKENAAEVQQQEEKVVEKVQEVLKAPKEEEKIYSMTFKVWGTLKQLQGIKSYLEELKKDGVRYE